LGLVIFGSAVIGSAVYALSIIGAITDNGTDSDSTTIHWVTDESSDSEVCYQPNAVPDWGSQAIASLSAPIYVVAVSALQSNKVWAVGFNVNSPGNYNNYILFYNGNAWGPQYAITGSKRYLGIYALDETHIWAVGEGGNIMFSSGNGNWSPANYTNIGTNNLYDINGADVNNIFISGGTTTDGALFICDGTGGANGTCNKKFGVAGSGPIISISKPIWTGSEYAVWLIENDSKRICFNAPATSGYGACPNAQKYQSTFILDDIFALDNNHVWAAGTGNIIFYNGTIWTTQRNTAETYFSIGAFYESASNKYHVWSGGSAAKLLYSDNGGANLPSGAPSWQDQTGKLNDLGMYLTLLSIDAYDQSEVWLGGYSKNIYHYGINYGTCIKLLPQVTVHDVFLDRLAANTLYSYKVCSTTALGKTVCSGNQTFKTKGFCSDGTAYSTCNALLQYCDNGTLTQPNNCAHCGVNCLNTPSTPYCDPATEACAQKCLPNGTIPGQCDGTKWCDPASITLKSFCGQCGVSCTDPSKPYCNDSSGICEPNCTDGTGFGTCNGSDQYCDNGTLTQPNNCARCSYPCTGTTPYCGSGESCEKKCLPNGTDPGQCDGTKWCDPASITLKSFCGQCGVSCTDPTKPYCNTSSGICEDKCPGGIDKGACSGNKYCDPADLNLKSFCGQCSVGCTDPTKPYCNTTTGVCENKCTDGTGFSQCNYTTKEYCDNGTLKKDCRQTCGYTCSDPTPQCNQTTGVCELDNTPPIIENIQVNPDVSLVTISWDTKNITGGFEEANSKLILSTGCGCTPDVALVFDGTYVTSRIFTINNLIPSTKYYYCISSADRAGNSSTVSECTQFFTTLAAPDTTPPTIQITKPDVSGTTISGTFSLEATATDIGSGIDHVEFSLNPGGTLASLPPSADDLYKHSWDTTSTANGSYDLIATAFDGAGNRATDSKTIIVDNDTTAPEITNVQARVFVGADENYAAEITWDTNEPADSRVDYTEEDSYGNFNHNYGGAACSSPRECSLSSCGGGHCLKVTDLATSHSLTVTGLAANQRYHYRVTSCDAKINCSQ